MAEGNADLHQDEGRMLAEGIVATIREPLLILNGDLTVQSANRAFYDTFAVDPAETEGRLVYDLGNRQWDLPELRRLLGEVLPENEFFEDFEVEHEFAAIGRRTVLLNARRVDRLQLILLAMQDITARRRAEQQREVLVAELNHRVKNLFAVIRALITQSDGARAAAEARQVLLGRLDALARAHDLLFESQWQGADLRALAAALQPFAAGRAGAIEIDGPQVRLNARQAVSVSLVLHELATNAAKYGALALPEGRVHLAWQIEPAAEGRQLRLLWHERHGPPVAPPHDMGFGTKLIERAFAFDLDGTADLAFEPEGVRFTAMLPLA
jgi:two-component system, chemotaxis family, CheB/CheR fusion protein